jgi:RNA polymerase sigma factor (sigma-70 family)
VERTTGYLEIVSTRTLSESTPEEFIDFVSPYLERMARLAQRLASTAEADDIVQEALIRAWMKRSQYDASRGTLAVWLLAITYDQARRARRNRPREAPLAPAASHPSIDETIDLSSAVERLAPRQRLAIDCFYFAGLSVTETAAVMRCSQGTVKSTLADARAQLRRAIGGTGVPD